VRRRSHRPLALLTALGLVAVLGSCAQEADGPLAADEAASAAPDDATGADTPDGTGDPGGGEQIAWEDCGSAECGTLEVPVDYAVPDGDTLTLSISRVPAGSDDRIGALFVNPGGPGGTAADFAISMALVLPDEVTDRFDIVGVDPRGLGASEIACDGDMEELYGVDYSIDSPEDTTALLDVSQDYVDGCAQNVGDLLSHLGTEDVARDIDAVRAAMGDDQLNYLGFSYGTAIGQQLAELFPDRVRAMIIDGIVDLGPTGVETAIDQAAGFEVALQSFADDCNSDSSCPIAPDAIGAIEQLQALVEQAPVPAEPRDLGPGELSTGLALPLYSESLWPDLADAVAAGLAGDGSDMVDLADQYLGVADFDVYFAVNCLDWEWPEVPQELLDAGAAAVSESPHFAEPIVNDYVRCAMWPVEEAPMPAVTAPDAPPILVVSTTNDPATPYEAGVRTAERLASGVLLTYEGDGHTVVGNGVPCVDDIATAYLVDLEVPDDGTTC
jgi:pimeloyl-ACP methyl ester carboxylesterase